MGAKQFQKSFVLTVAESKRLIARGVARSEVVETALKDGIVAVAKGTTNGYIAEELLGESIHKPDYCTGTTRPPGRESEVKVANKLPDLVIRNGERWEGVSATESVDEMGPGDVFIKGANALNYDREQAGILIGHPTGGTIGAAIGSLISRRGVLLLPVGLEKSIPGDLYRTSHAVNAMAEAGSGPSLWPVSGLIFTELEALETLTDVTAMPLAAGGILGAEGSVRVSAWGTEKEIESAESIVEEIRGEPPFGND
ncbi:MAG: hypothetical protein KGZ25_01910 [Planctomycetes bacterium]|nr:hypothetical protein [Planctomycetota bacterium]